MTEPFVHLHVKSQFTMLGAVGTPEDYVRRAKDLSMAALALTDEMNLFAAVEFWKACKAEGLHAIVGAELILAPGSRHDKNKPRENHRLVALVEDQDGYVFLNHLVSEGYLTGRHYVPRIDLDYVRELRAAGHRGLIVMSGDLRGEIPRLLAAGRVDEARTAARSHLELWGAGNFYLQLMDLGWGGTSAIAGEADQRAVNDGLRRLSAELSIPLVATNSVHYPRQDDAFAHEIAMCVGNTQTLTDEFRFRFPSDQFFLKSGDQMAALFPDDGEALRNTARIAARCRFAFELGAYRFPVYPRLSGRTPEAVLGDLARAGLERRLEAILARSPEAARPDEAARYRARLEEELAIIETMRFAAYFLIVYDFINWAKEHAIPVGPGRGSGAGSLVLYSLRITDIDPLPYKLLFERFLNPERISMPDVDVDFCQDRRNEVIEYVNSAYGGSTRVSQIITYSKMLAKGVLRDVGRVMGLPLQDVDRIARLVPQELGIELKEAVEKEPKIKEAMAADPRIARLVGLAEALEGTVRNAGVHAAGVVIADDDLRRYVPLYKGAAEDDPVVTQFDMKWSETVGLIKFDFLGLKTVTQIKNALDMARAAGKTEWTFDRFCDVPLDDADVYKMLARGDTLGVFQLESSGMRELLHKLKPTVFEDIIAVAALYRPGPMGLGMHNTFAECKHNPERVQYPHPNLEPILRDTYGVIVFQEQVMQIAQVMAGYSLGEADLLRRAMGKKKKEEMDKQRERFLRGAAERGYGEKNAGDVFDLMAEFANYGFNKSHTAAYGLVAYQTGWLKHHLPAEFYASLLTIESASSAKVLLYLDDARRHGIDVLPPDVNESSLGFAVVGTRVRFGLGAVKGLGEGAIESILEAREAGGRFKDVADFVERVDPRRCNKRVLEALVKCGAFDSMGVSRAALSENLTRLQEYAARRADERASGQVGLFGLKAATAAPGFAINPIPEWPNRHKLAMEKEALGLYITGHPMDGYRAEVEQFATHSSQDIEERQLDLPRDVELKVAGMAVATRIVTTKAKGERMAFVQFEDMVGAMEVTFFPRAWAQAEEVVASGEPLLLRAKLDGASEDGAVKLLAEGAELLAAVRERDTREVRVRVRADEADSVRMARLREALLRFPGEKPVKIELQLPNAARVLLTLPDGLRVRPNDAMVEATEQVFGRRVCAFG